MVKRLENFVGESIRANIVFKKSYCINDFVNDYNAFKGNAYGLANTLTQTAILKPKIKNQETKKSFLCRSTHGTWPRRTPFDYFR